MVGSFWSLSLECAQQHLRNTSDYYKDGHGLREDDGRPARPENTLLGRRSQNSSVLSLGEAKREDLILTGNVHAMLSPVFHYAFAAMYLPAKEVLSLEVTDRGRESWSTANGACGPSTGGVGDKMALKPYGIHLDPKLAPFGKVDGVLALDVPLTSSTPAAGGPTPLPACRSKFLADHGATRN